jgi:hypothetical protein
MHNSIFLPLRHICTDKWEISLHEPAVKDSVPLLWNVAQGSTEQMAPFLSARVLFYINFQEVFLWFYTGEHNHSNWISFQLPNTQKIKHVALSGGFLFCTTVVRNSTPRPETFNLPDVSSGVIIRSSQMLWLHCPSWVRTMLLPSASFQINYSLEHISKETYI